MGELGYEDYPRLLVFNKADEIDAEGCVDLLAAHHDSLAISALHGQGIDRLLKRIERALPARTRRAPASGPPSHQPSV